MKIKHAGAFNWTVELIIVCPYCHEIIDYEGTDNGADILNDYEVCEEVINLEAQCTRCERDFIFDIEEGR